MRKDITLSIEGVPGEFEFSPQLFLQRGMTILCRWPYAEAANEPGPEDRPALVVNVCEHSDTPIGDLDPFPGKNSGICSLLVAYGTTQFSNSNTGYELHVERGSERAACDLNRKTRFTLSRMRLLPYDDRYFRHDHALGHLPKKLQNKLNDLANRIANKHSKLTRLLQSRRGVAIDNFHRPIISDVPVVNPDVALPESVIDDVDLYLRCNFTGRSAISGSGRSKRNPAKHPEHR